LLNVGDLIAALPRAWRDVPVALYMHQNQIAYPTRPNVEPAERDVHFALTNLTSALVADRVIWNSDWNRRSFLEGIEAVLARSSDTTLRDVVQRIAERSIVIWPPVEPPPVVEPPILHNLRRPRNDTAIRVLWPHRWEHDKGPEELLALAAEHTTALDLRWTILGARFSETPPAMEAFCRRFADRIDHVGFVEDRADYWRHLRHCDWVLSTARHEFFGVAVVEAMLAGCLPWLPDRLSYPELLPPIARGLSPMNPPADAAAVRAAVAPHLAPALAPEAVARLDRVVDAI
jgi:glycosyltransferase involved in cell wall biosynthesis